MFCSVNVSAYALSQTAANLKAPVLVGESLREESFMAMDFTTEVEGSKSIQDGKVAEPINDSVSSKLGVVQDGLQALYLQIQEDKQQNVYLSAGRSESRKTHTDTLFMNFYLECGIAALLNDVCV